eukprot:768590-Hanusia_phi.AAC.12
MGWWETSRNMIGQGVGREVEGRGKSLRMQNLPLHELIVGDHIGCKVDFAGLVEVACDRPAENLQKLQDSNVQTTCNVGTCSPLFC